MQIDWAWQKEILSNWSLISQTFIDRNMIHLASDELLSTEILTNWPTMKQTAVNRVTVCPSTFQTNCHQKKTACWPNKQLSPEILFNCIAERPNHYIQKHWQTNLYQQKNYRTGSGKLLSTETLSNWPLGRWTAIVQLVSDKTNSCQKKQ